MSWPAVVLWIVLVFGILMPPRFLLYCFFAFGSFATLDLIPHELVGGFNMNSQSFCALLRRRQNSVGEGPPAPGARGGARSVKARGALSLPRLWLFFCLCDASAFRA